jgi:hypothetical protein
MIIIALLHVKSGSPEPRGRTPQFHNKFFPPDPDLDPDAGDWATIWNRVKSVERDGI